MKKALQLALGIITSVGGFFDIGNLVTAAQAGARFRFQLLWALLLGTLLVIFLVEMAGRFAAVTGKAIPEAVREHLGFRVWVGPFVVLVLLHVLTIAAELGGICFALQLVSGVPFVAWVLPVGVLVWLMLWRTTFDAVEYSVAIIGMITLAFVVGALRHHPPAGEVMAGLLPTRPGHDTANYWFLAVSIVGALIAPYLFYFYSSGAIEDKWDRTYVWVNRGVAVIGMGFGAVISAGLLIASGMVFAPLGIRVESLNEAALVLTKAFPFWGFALFAVSLGVACLGAMLEVTLSLAYTMAQTFGWHWGESEAPHRNARFATVYTLAIVAGCAIMLTGLDPMKLTMVTMALNAALLPIVAIPFLLLMNNGLLLREHANGVLSNVVVGVTVILSLVLAVVSIPLLFVGS